MADGITIEGNFQEVLARFGGAKAYIVGATKKVVSAASIKLNNHIKQDCFQSYRMQGPKNEHVLFSRSRELRNSVKVKQSTVEGTEVSGGVTIGKRYSVVHFGKRGTSMTMTGRPWLTIPLPAALDSQGVVRGSAKSGIYGKTFFRKSKTNSDDLVLYGMLTDVKGENAGKTSASKTYKAVGGKYQTRFKKGSAVPLFVLKHSVTVPARIHPEDLQEYIMPHITEGLQAIKAGLENSSLSDNFGTGTDGII